MKKRRSHAEAPQVAGAADPFAFAERAVLAVAAVLGALWAFQLARQAARGVFATDECFHAYATEWILAHHRLPATFPELYSGFYYYYHPMLHLVGALCAAVFGLGVLHVLPAAFAAATLAVLLLGVPRDVPPAARAVAVLLCLTNLSLAHFAVRFYVEGLTTLEFALAGALLLHHERGGRRRAALGLGVVTGLALLTKFTGWLLLAFIAVRAVFLAFRGERARAADLALALALALLIAAPWLVRNQLLFGSPVYPVLAPDMDRALYALNSHKFSVPPLDFLRATPGALGWPISVMALAALIVAAARRNGSLRTWLLAFSIVGVISVAFTPMAATRHLNPFLPLLTLASAAILIDAIAARRVAALTLCGALVVVASTVVFALPEVRATADAPEYLRDAFREIGPRLPERSTVLSLWTYDTFYYTRRAATWPIPWGQKSHPVEMFYERDPDRFLAELDRHGIDYLLIPRELRSREFDSANYPASFMVLADSLVKRGDLQVTWASERLALVHRMPAATAR